MGYYFQDYLHDDRGRGRRKAAVTHAVKAIRRFMADGQGQRLPDFIAVCGCSGLSIGSIIAYELGVPCVIVRKEHDARTSHCNGIFLSPDPIANKRDSKYVIVDDFIAGGGTVMYIKDKLKHCTCLGFYSYADDGAQDTRCREHRLVRIK